MSFAFFMFINPFQGGKKSENQYKFKKIDAFARYEQIKTGQNARNKLKTGSTLPKKGNCHKDNHILLEDRRHKVASDNPKYV